jgi:pimeloyl-ACP methyl ester carboxylesterase
MPYPTSSNRVRVRVPAGGHAQLDEASGISGELRPVLDADAVRDVGDARRGPGGGHRVFVCGLGADRAGQDHQPIREGLDHERRLIVAGSGPGRVPDLPARAAKVGQVAGHPVLDDDDFLYLFFPETDQGRRAGLASLRRLDARLSGSHVEVAPEAIAAQRAALAAFRTGVWDRLGELTLPVLVANGAHDVMIHAFASYAMSQRLPNAKVILYSDAGHAFLFQHADDFGREVLNFLR